MSDIDSLPPLRDVIATHELRAEKKLGQNFLLDLNITDKIAATAGDLHNTTVFEIGPGPGGLTRSLLKAGAKKVIAIEYDTRAVNALQTLVDAAAGRLSVVHGDALKTNLLDFPAEGNRVLVANLPYNIATPLLIGWLKQIRQNPKNYQSMILMFQREVAERLIAVPGTKAYGRLSVITQWLCTTKKRFNLPPGAFTPPPKIASSIVQFTPKTLPDNAPSFDAVGRLTAAAFGQRRKMLRSSLKDYTETMKKTGINADLRAENLSVDDFIALATTTD